MLIVTEEAKDVLGQVLANSDADEDQTLRLTRNMNDEFGLAIDEERAGDQVVSHGPQTVLLIENELAHELQGVTLDATQLPEGPSLRMLRNDEPPLSQNGTGA